MVHSASRPRSGARLGGRCLFDQVSQWVVGVSIESDAHAYRLSSRRSADMAVYSYTSFAASGIRNVRSDTLFHGFTTPGTQMLQQHRSHVGKRRASISHKAGRLSTRQIREDCSCSENPQRDQEETKGSINTRSYGKKEEKSKNKRCAGAVRMYGACK